MNVADIAVDRPFVLSDVRESGRRNLLASLGIHEGRVCVKLKECPFRGPVSILVDGNCVAIRRCLAEKLSCYLVVDQQEEDPSK